MNDSIRVLIVDDHAGVRKGVESLVNTEWPHMRSVGAAATAMEALRLAQERGPSVVVLDADLAGEDGLALIPILRRTVPCRVVVLTSLVDKRVATRALRLGADACMHKTAPAAELLACIAAPSNTFPANTGSATSHVARDDSAGHTRA